MEISQKGVASVLLIILLLVGLGIGLYAFQNARTTLLPKASTNTKLAVNFTQSSCSTAKNDYQSVTADWTKVDGAVAYKLIAYRVGSNIRQSLSEECARADLNSPSYNQKLAKELPTGDQYEVTVEAYADINCSGGFISADSKQVTGQSSCVVTDQPTCDTLAVQNKKFGLYTQKNCSATPQCSKDGKPVYKCTADVPYDTKCVDYIRPVSETASCLTNRDFGSSD